MDKLDYIAPGVRVPIRRARAVHITRRQRVAAVMRDALRSLIEVATFAAFTLAVGSWALILFHLFG